MAIKLKHTNTYSNYFITLTCIVDPVVRTKEFVRFGIALDDEKGIRNQQQQQRLAILATKQQTDRNKWTGKVAALEYIHQNPVVAGFVHEGTDWVYSSARRCEKNDPSWMSNLRQRGGN